MRLSEKIHLLQKIVQRNDHVYQTVYIRDRSRMYPFDFAVFPAWFTKTLFKPSGNHVCLTDDEIVFLDTHGVFVVLDGQGYGVLVLDNMWHKRFEVRRTKTPKGFGMYI